MSKIIDSKSNDEELEWIQLNKELMLLRDESRADKMVRKVKNNPLVPIGCGATLIALSCGLWVFAKGNKRRSQHMMRARVAAQGFTVFALVYGIGALGWSFNTNKNDE